MDTNIINLDNSVSCTSDFPDGSSQSTLFFTTNCAMEVYEVGVGNGVKHHFSHAVSVGDTFMDLLTGEKYKKIIEMLITAVNNRTIERNYFKKYSEIGDEFITEEEFEEELDNNTQEYIVKQDGDPDFETVDIALKLAERIKDVESLDDLSSLFSFSPLALESLVEDVYGEVEK